MAADGGLVGAVAEPSAFVREKLRLILTNFLNYSNKAFPRIERSGWIIRLIDATKILA